jgi:hypothetical protein
MSPARSNRWDALDRMLGDPNRDPLDLLRTVAQYERFLQAIENEAVKLARATGSTWEQIGEAVGRTRQTVWQRHRSESVLDKALMEKSLRNVIKGMMAGPEFLAP